MIFKDVIHTKVLACKHLLAGGTLFRVYHLSQKQHTWQFMCEVEHNEEDMCEVSLGEILALYPEVEELEAVPDDMDVMLQKGVQSGKWYDFHIN